MTEKISIILTYMCTPPGLGTRRWLYSISRIIELSNYQLPYMITQLPTPLIRRASPCLMKQSIKFFLRKYICTSSCFSLWCFVSVCVHCVTLSSDCLCWTESLVQWRRESWRSDAYAHPQLLFIHTCNDVIYYICISSTRLCLVGGSPEGRRLPE